MHSWAACGTALFGSLSPLYLFASSDVCSQSHKLFTIFCNIGLRTLYWHLCESSPLVIIMNVRMENAFGRWIFQKPTASGDVRAVNATMFVCARNHRKFWMTVIYQFHLPYHLSVFRLKKRVCFCWATRNSNWRKNATQVEWREKNPKWIYC